MMESENYLRVEKIIGVKLFVGQIPKIWKEEEILEFFQQFGKVQDAQIIRDPQGIHRGCAFITFLSITEADITMTALNEAFFLPGSTAKLQLKWADGEDRRLGLEGISLENANKLILECVPSSIEQDDLKEIFTRFGHVRLLKIIKSGQAYTRAYLKYATKEQAINAVKEMNGKTLLPGFNKVLLINYAESKRINKNVPFGQLAKTNILGSSHIDSFRYTDNNNNEHFNHSNKFTPSVVPVHQPQSKEIYYMFRDKSGEPYYYSKVTQKSQWEKPEGENVLIKSSEDFQNGL
jgi:RNA recognition motif-containing protein